MVYIVFFITSFIRSFEITYISNFVFRDEDIYHIRKTNERIVDFLEIYMKRTTGAQQEDLIYE